MAFPLRCGCWDKVYTSEFQENWVPLLLYPLSQPPLMQTLMLEANVRRNTREWVPRPFALSFLVPFSHAGNTGSRTLLLRALGFLPTFLRPAVISVPLLMEAKSAERPSSAAAALGSSFTMGGGGGMPATGVHSVTNNTKVALNLQHNSCSINAYSKTNKMSQEISK